MSRKVKPQVNRNALPFTWHTALLAIVPGLVATAGLVNTDFSTRMLVGLILLMAFLVFAYWRSNKQWPAWSLMAAGMMASVGLTITSGVLGGLAAVLVGGSANTLVLLVFLVALVVLWIRYAQRHHVSPLVWILLAAIVACHLLTRLKYFVLFGVSWSVVGQWLNISLYAATVALLLPVTLGAWLSERHGLPAMLFIIGMIYGGFQILIDVNDRVSGQTKGTLGFIAYQVMIPLLFTVIAPLWFLRAPSSRSRIGGLLALVGLAVMLNLVIVGLSYRGDLPLMIWISFIPYTASVLLTLASAYLIYRENAPV